MTFKLGQPTRRALAGLAYGLAFGIVSTTASAQGEFPSKPINIIISFPAGGLADLIARSTAQEASKILHQTIVIESRPGASQIIAANAVARAEPDGYTLLVGTDGVVTLNPHLFKDLSYKVNELTPIVDLAESRVVLSGAKSLAGNTLQDIIEYAKANPGKLNFGSLGVGSTHHLLLESLKRTAGIDITHVPYQGYAPAITDLVANQVQLVSGGIGPPALGYLRDGATKPLAVSGSTRSSLLPDTPTFAEAGYAEVPPKIAFMVFGPANVPEPIVTKINQAFAQAVKQPAIVDIFLKNGLEPLGNTPSQLKGELKAQHDKYATIVRETGIKLD